jgi:transcriptional regulator
MYQPPHFRITDERESLALIRARPLGLLITGGASGLVANPIPFALIEGESGAPHRLVAHLAKANPQLKEIGEGIDALVVFQGDDAYVSPSFYPSKREHGKVVPTWNYVTVQARGRATLRPDADWLRGQIARVTDRHESGRAEPWRVTDAPDDFVAAQLKGIVGVEIELRSIEGKAKLSQNRNETDHAGVVAGLAAEADPAARAVAEAMRR